MTPSWNPYWRRCTGWTSGLTKVADVAALDRAANPNHAHVLDLVHAHGVVLVHAHGADLERADRRVEFQVPSISN
jgi:hypothetical protein